MKTAAVLTSRHFSTFWRNICLHLHGGRAQASQSHILERGNFHSRCLGGISNRRNLSIFTVFCALRSVGLRNLHSNNTKITFGTFWGIEYYLPSRRCYRCPTVVAILYSCTALEKLQCVSPWARYSVAAPYQKTFNSRFPRSPKSLSQTPKQEADACLNLNPSETVLLSGRKN